MTVGFVQGQPEIASQPAGRRLRILSLASVFPHPLQKDLGRFVRSRLLAMTEYADVKVIVPVAYLEYGNPARRGLGIGKVPQRYADGSLEVLHPRWQYLPNAGPLTALLMALQLFFHFARLRRAFKFDVIDAHFAFPEGIAAALLSRLLNSPYTITVRGSEIEHSKRFFRGRAIRWALRSASHVIAVSNRLREFAIAAGADPQRTTTIPNGVDSTHYYPRPGRQILRKFQIPDNVPLILSAGYLIELKGHHRAVQALNALARDGSHAHMIIAGGPGANGRRFHLILRKLIEDLGLASRVHLIGQVAPDQLAQLMAAADVFVLASTREGWPNVVNEALACGTPVVATDVGAVPQLLPTNDYGLVVPVNDQTKLERALAEALNRGWDRTRIAMWGSARSWEKVASEVIESLERAVATSGKR